MYKVFFNDRIVFINTSLGKTFLKDGILKEVSLDTDMEKIWIDFLNDELSGNMFLTGESIEMVWAKFCTFFKIIEAAGGVVYNKKGDVLCIYRLNKWDLPKGKIEKGESIEEAAIREVEEETGIKGVSIEKALETTYHIYFHKNTWVLKPTYWFQMKHNGNDALKPQLNENITKAKWVASMDASELANETYSSLKSLFLACKK